MLANHQFTVPELVGAAVVAYLIFRRLGLIDGFWPAVWQRVIVGPRDRAGPIGCMVRVLLMFVLLHVLLGFVAAQLNIPPRVAPIQGNGKPAKVQPVSF